MCEFVCLYFNHVATAQPNWKKLVIDIISDLKWHINYFQNEAARGSLYYFVVLL